MGVGVISTTLTITEIGRRLGVSRWAAYRRPSVLVRHGFVGRR
ncbi:helix-turn-helix domain-containing protein [Capillimicrobium parvum]|nr:helix-turn-helix domain-containing protein [Capillimicrobium parvum]